MCIRDSTHIEKRDGGAAYTEDDGATWTELPMDATVSMNMWGFSASILKELKDRFPLFLKENVEKNQMCIRDRSLVSISNQRYSTSTSPTSKIKFRIISLHNHSGYCSAISRNPRTSRGCHSQLSSQALSLP